LHQGSVHPIRWIAGALSLVFALGTFALLLTGVGSSAAASRAREANEKGKLVRWDIAKCESRFCDALVVGGHGRWRSNSGDRIKFTGTGQAEPHEGEAAGGGTWTRKDSKGHVLRRGSYKVIGFISWRGFGGILGNVADAIGSRKEVRSGVLKLRVQFIPRNNGQRPVRISRGRLVIASDSGGPPVPAKSHLILHTASGRTITYWEGKRLARGQTLLHHIR
jgi:hypothetical protein